MFLHVSMGMLCFFCFAMPVSNTCTRYVLDTGGQQTQTDTASIASKSNLHTLTHGLIIRRNEIK